METSQIQSFLDTYLMVRALPPVPAGEQHRTWITFNPADDWQPYASHGYVCTCGQGGERRDRHSATAAALMHGCTGRHRSQRPALQN